MNNQTKIMSLARRALLVSTLALSIHTSGQQIPDRSDRFEKIRTMKVGFISQRLSLTSKQSEQFWPVYNEFEQEQRNLREQFRGERRRGEKLEAPSDRDAMQSIDDNLQRQEAMIDLKRKYKERFLKVITPQQVASLYDAERDFKQMLLERLKSRRRGDRD